MGTRHLYWILTAAPHLQCTGNSWFEICSLICVLSDADNANLRCQTHRRIAVCKMWLRIYALSYLNLKISNFMRCRFLVKCRTSQFKKFAWKEKCTKLFIYVHTDLFLLLFYFSGPIASSFTNRYGCRAVTIGRRSFAKYLLFFVFLFLNISLVFRWAHFATDSSYSVT